MRVRVGSSLSLCSDTVVSMAEYPQQAGAAGSGGAAAVQLQGVVAVQVLGDGASAFPG